MLHGIYNVEELAKELHMTVGQIYSMCSKRGQSRMEHPIPFMKLNGNLRFNARDIREWLNKIAARKGR